MGSDEELVLEGLKRGDLNGGPYRMASIINESLQTLHVFAPEDIFRRYLAWYEQGAFDTGEVAWKVLKYASHGMSRERAVLQTHDCLHGKTAGVNPAHRIAPLAASRYVSDQDLARFALEEARLTHWDPLAGDVSAAVAVLIRSLFRGIPWREALEIASSSRAEETTAALKLEETTRLSSGGYAPDTLRSAIHFLNEHDGFEGALTASFEFAGFANYCPVLVGSIGAARWKVAR